MIRQQAQPAQPANPNQHSWRGRLGLVTCAIFALFQIALAASPANAAMIGDVMRQETRHFGKVCHSIKFEDGYLTQFDFNNDKLTDVITNPDKVTCDGIRNPECSLLGCPHRFYVHLLDGSYVMIAEIQFYSWTHHMRYGNQVLVLTTQGGFCHRATMEVCKVTYRVRDTRFVELGRE